MINGKLAQRQYVGVFVWTIMHTKHHGGLCNFVIAICQTRITLTMHAHACVYRREYTPTPFNPPPPHTHRRVVDLFHSVSLNVNNPHFLIMQGMITKVLNMKPPEILGMLEEAAGTRMYETKRQGALKTLEKKQSKVDEINKVGVMITKHMWVCVCGFVYVGLCVGCTGG